MAYVDFASEELVQGLPEMLRAMCTRLWQVVWQSCVVKLRNGRERGRVSRLLCTHWAAADRVGFSICLLWRVKETCSLPLPLLSG